MRSKPLNAALRRVNYNGAEMSTEICDEQYRLYPWYSRPRRIFRPVNDMLAYAPATGEVFGGCVGHIFGPFLKGLQFSLVYLTVGVGTLSLLAGGLLLYVKQERRRRSRRQMARFLHDLELVRRR